MSNIRYVPPGGAVLEVTCRTIQGRLLLRPSPKLQEIVIGVLHCATVHYPDIKIYNFVFLSNHYHLLLWSPDARTLARFMGFVNGNLSRKLGPLVDWSGPLWARRYEAIPVASDEKSLIRRFVYLLSHGVKEGLVRDPRDWPGPHGANALLAEGRVSGHWFDSTKACRDRARNRSKPDSSYRNAVVLHLSKLPCWQHLDWEEIAKRVLSLIQSIIQDGAAMHSGVLGCQRIKKQNPMRRIPRPQRRRRPLIHANCRSLRQQFVEAYRAFLAAYREASLHLQRGNLSAQFPRGSCRPPGPWCPA